MTESSATWRPSARFRLAWVGAVILAAFLPLDFAAAAESRLIQFEIEDQFKQPHTHEDLLGSIVVVIGSDKDGSKYNTLWGQAIDDSLSAEPGYEAIVFLPVADVRGVPFFLKGHVRGKFPKDERKWTLVDWDGRFAKAYEFVPGQSNVLVFDRQGALVLSSHGTEPDAIEVQKIVALLRTLMQAADSPRE